MFDPNFEIHIWDLPEETTYVILEEKFRKNLFQKAISSVGGKRKLGKYLNRSVNKFIQGKHRTSLKVIELILNIIASSNTEKKKFWELVEKNVIEIRCGGKYGSIRALSIFNPKFPIRLTSEFGNFLGHVVGDGTIYQGSMYGIISYFNNERTLMKNFIEKTMYVFGDAEYREDKKRRNYSVRFSKLIGIILEKIIGDLDSFRGNISSLMLKVKNRFIISAFLKAIYDDEAHVSFKKKTWTREIVLSMKGKRVIESIHGLLTKINIQPNPIREIKNVKMKGVFRERFFDKAWENGVLKKLKISEKRYKEYRAGKKGRFGVLPTLSLVKKICQFCDLNLKSVLDKSELKSMYVFSVSSQQNLKKFASIIGFDHPIKKAKLNVLLKSYRFDNLKTKTKLLELLKESNKSTSQLAKETNFRIYYVRSRLKELKKEGKVICARNIRHDRRGYFVPYTWRIDPGSN